MSSFQTEAYPNVVTGAATAAVRANIDMLLTLIPNPDVPPAQAGKSGFLDMMSPGAASQLRAEIEALRESFTSS